MSPDLPRDSAQAARLDLARAHLGAGRPLVLRAEGHSMWPLVHDGDHVVVHPIDAPLALGDIALVVHGGRLVLHRVVAFAPDGVITKGDAVARADAPVALADVLGALPRASPLFNRLVAALSLRASRPLAASLQRLRLVVARFPV